MSARAETIAAGEAESRQMARLGVPLVGAGVVYLCGAIVLYQSLAKLPTVGVLQALAPALEGRAHVPVSPIAPEIRYIAHHAFGLIAGSTLQALSIALLTLGLLFLLQSTSRRAAEPSSAARMLVMIGGGASAFALIFAQLVRAIRTHQFDAGHAFGQHAVESAINAGTANQIAGYLGLLMPIVLVVGMIMALLRATRAGLLTRWQRTFGIIAAVVLMPIFSGAFTLQIIPAAWMVTFGFLLLGRAPGGTPPAWAAGEAIPWPSGGKSTPAGEAGAPAGDSAAAAANGRAGAGVSSRARRRREKGGR